MNYTVIREDELYHHGILGQKWGVRRYQNEDGSLTNAGRRRYGEDLDIKDKSRTNVAKIRLGEARRRLDEAKRTDSGGQGELKDRVRAAKRELRLQKKIDKGQRLYQKGHTITGNKMKRFLAGGAGIIASKKFKSLLNQGLDNLGASGKLAPHHVQSAKILSKVGDKVIDAATLAYTINSINQESAMRSYLHRSGNITGVGSKEYADVKKRRQGK